MRFRVLVFLLLVLASGAVAAQTPSSPASVRIPRVATPPVIEHYLDSVARPDEAAITTFVQREPGVSPDGSRFLMIRPAEDTPASRAQLVLVQHWAEELRTPPAR